MDKNAAFIKKLGEQVEAETSGILAKANAEKDEIISAAQKAADRFNTASLKELVDIEMACKMAVSSRRSKGSNVKINVEALKEAQKNINAVFKDAKKNVKTLTKQSGYEKLLKTILDEVLDGMGAGVTLTSNKKDMVSIKKFLSTMSMDVNFKVDDDIIGGVVAESKDGRVRNNNTLLARLARLEKFIVKDVNKVLHEQSA